MAKIAAIVEGDGEVEAVPVLIRRIGLEVSPLSPPTILRPIRVRRQRILKEGELERYVGLAAARAGDGGAPQAGSGRPGVASLPPGGAA